MVIRSYSVEIETLKKFLKLVVDEKNHKLLMKDKKIALYAATNLDSENLNVLKLCLDIFEKLVENTETHNYLISIFGIYESLQSLCIRMRNFDKNIYHRASKITEILRSATPPALNTRSKNRAKNSNKKQTVYLLYVPDLDKDSQRTFENTLLKTKGVISFLTDLETKRCTLRLCSNTWIKEVIEKVYRKSGFKCLVVKKNKNQENETFYNLLTQTMDDRSYLEYPQEDFLQKSGAITSIPNEQEPKKGFVHSIVNFWNESFYW
ncbi:uncharacterized protein LOC115880358 [Sitophilus oryzae]|uniref:Uncharacterized protein LOC115880358 n=1 Tax=Sitophilus oryzae TaxID=7048 RepID=A0A6J2XS25_SITOR|nr:uncharacterized protein LOC115880358 [Sitophilus oryzae]